MTYKMEDTEWKFTAPHEGEVNSAKLEADRIREYDGAIMTPQQLLQTVGNGENEMEITFGVDRDGVPVTMVIDGDPETYKRDDYQSALLKRDVYVTNQHYHPTPVRVPLSDESVHAAKADSSTNATSADKLSSPFSINGKYTDGTRNIEIGLDDYEDSRRVFYGTEDPIGVDFPRALRPGDLYVRYSDVTSGTGSQGVIDGSYATASIPDEWIISLLGEGAYPPPEPIDDETAKTYTFELKWPSGTQRLQPDDVVVTLSDDGVAKYHLSGRMEGDFVPENVMAPEIDKDWLKVPGRTSWLWRIALPAKLEFEEGCVSFTAPFGFAYSEPVYGDKSSFAELSPDGGPKLLGIRDDTDSSAGDMKFAIAVVTPESRIADYELYGYVSCENTDGCVAQSDFGAVSYNSAEYSEFKVGESNIVHMPLIYDMPATGESATKYIVMRKGWIMQGDERVETPMEPAFMLVHAGGSIIVYETMPGISATLSWQDDDSIEFSFSDESYAPPTGEDG